MISEVPPRWAKKKGELTNQLTLGITTTFLTRMGVENHSKTRIPPKNPFRQFFPFFFAVTMGERVNHSLATHIQYQAEFSAAYRLSSPQLSEAENQATYGPCFSPHYHGHTFQLIVEVGGAVQDTTGMLMDYVELAKIVQEQIIQPLDHKNLCIEVDFLQGVNPTSENLCAAFWPRLADALPAGVVLCSLRLQESQSYAVVYDGPSA